MEIKYQCSLQDYLEAQYAHCRRSPAYYTILGCIFAFVGAVGTYQLVTEGYPRGLLPFSVIIFWVLLRFVYRPLWFRRDFRKNPNFTREQTVRIDEDGLSYKNEVAQSEIKWSAFTRFRETANLFMLYSSARLFQVVPKRAFEGTLLEEFRKLLQRKVPAK